MAILVKETRMYINDLKVEKDGEFHGIAFYRQCNEPDDDHTIFVCKGDKVLGAVCVTAGCGQNMGYISGVDIIDGNDLFDEKGRLKQ